MHSHRLRLAIPLLLGVLISIAFPYLTIAQSSATFEIDNGQVGGSQFEQTSNGYTINGSVEPIVGGSSSNNFETEAGSPIFVPGTSTPVSPTPTPPTSGSMSGSFTVGNASCSVAYKDLTLLTGRKTPNIIYMFLNGEMSGFYFPDDRTWQKTAWLHPGNNQLKLWGSDDNNRTTTTITLGINKLRMGDINQDGLTNDYDLSLLANKWNQRGDCATDLNRDLITDDYDLSYLAAYWNR